MKYLLTLIIAAAVATAFVVLQPFAAEGEPTSVLFVGNSYTQSNDLAGMFAELAASGGHNTKVEVVAWGGAWLSDHVDKKHAETALTGGDWAFVVLQEQSIVPAAPTERTTDMYPAIRQLVEIANQWDTEPVLFLTWARRDGFPDVGYTAYEPMQQAITSAYEEIAEEVGARIAPVGEAWAVARSFDLYQSDGSHPSVLGTYLAASVFYAAIFGEDPAELGYDAGLESADTLRWTASRIVLDDSERWHVPPAAGS